MEDLITMKEAMELLKYSSRTTVYKFCKVYQIRTTKPMGRRLINRADIVKAFSANTVIMGV